MDCRALLEQTRGPCHSKLGQNHCMQAPPSFSTPPSPFRQQHNPLHGLTLETIVTALVAHYGWAGLGERIPVRCFTSDPSIASSLKFLRKTPWARDKVEGLYLFMLREIRRG
ncbi:MAG: hypothetical protein ACI9I0_001664 [Rhodoferax sp.]|jgi:hypothetical protein